MLAIVGRLLAINLGIVLNMLLWVAIAVALLSCQAEPAAAAQVPEVCQNLGVFFADIPMLEASGHVVHFRIEGDVILVDVDGFLTVWKHIGDYMFCRINNGELMS